MYVQDTVRIPLYARDGSVRAYTLVDAADAAFVNRWTWRLDRRGYAMRTERHGNFQPSIFLHRELLGLKPGDSREGDHRDRDRLNNTRANLRAITKGQNGQNVTGYGGSSRHRGVTWNAHVGKWQAAVQAAGKSHYLGLFNDEHDAATAAREARARLLPYSVD